MRLLQAADLELVEFFDSNFPKYAILSHTWDGEEVTLQEMQLCGAKGTADTSKTPAHILQKKGYTKVKNAAALADQDGFKYIWVDTCCIDKTSSAELQEAINSMFSWYARSDRCYAYLGDVPPATEEQPHAMDSRFRQSRWFTRGWTLQELIAPGDVQFIARDWTHLGRKGEEKQFINLLSDITGIEVSVLRGRKRLDQLSVASRMRWASHRQTTRAEDVAYCLLGIFSVYMPLLYGEGKRAFMRLQEEILKRTSDQSIFSWSSIESETNNEDSLHGLFAVSPLQFRDTIGIQNFPPSPTTQSVPISSTSHGLRVQLYLRPDLESYYATGIEDYYAILDCFVRIGDQEFCPVLWLRRLGFDQYARLRPQYRKLLPPVDYQVPDYVEGYRTVYVREKPVYHLPELRVPAPLDVPKADLLDGSATLYQFEEAYPEERWNPDTSTLTPIFSRSTEIVGIFRFSNAAKREEKIDVAVGLTMNFGMKWGAWCFQRRAHLDSLASCFDNINADIKLHTLQTRSPLHWFSLQFKLGEDHLLLSDARVTAVQLQARSYFHISMFAKPEICTFRELTMADEANAPPEMALGSESSHETLMARCAVEDAVYPHDPNMFMKSRAVRIKTTQMRSQEQSISSEIMELFLVEGVPNQTRFATPLTLAQNSNETMGDRLGAGSHIHAAVAKGNAQLVVNIMDTVPNAVLCETHGWTPLHLAAALGRLDVIHCILDHPTSRSTVGTLIDCRTMGLLETPLHLLAAYAPFNAQSSGLEVFCSHLSPDEGYTCLFSRNAIEETILHRAAASGADQLITLFFKLADERNKTYNRNVAFHEVIDTFRSDFVQQVDYVDMYGRTPLWHAAAAGSCSTISLLSSLGAQINLTDDLGLTALHAACREGQAEACHYLLKAGAIPHLETPLLGLSPCHYAAFFGHSDCLEILISSGANIDVGSEVKPLHLAVAAGELQCAQVLVSAGADTTVSADFILQPDKAHTSTRLVRPAGTLLDIALLGNDQRMIEFVKSLKQPQTQQIEGIGASAQPSIQDWMSNEIARRSDAQRALNLQANFYQATTTVSYRSAYIPFVFMPPSGTVPFVQQPPGGPSSNMPDGSDEYAPAPAIDPAGLATQSLARSALPEQQAPYTTQPSDLMVRESGVQWPPQENMSALPGLSSSGMFSAAGYHQSFPSMQRTTGRIVGSLEELWRVTTQGPDLLMLSVVEEQEDAVRAMQLAMERREGAVLQAANGDYIFELDGGFQANVVGMRGWLKTLGKGFTRKLGGGGAFPNSST